MKLLDKSKRPRSEETKRKISATLTGHAVSSEARAKISKSLSGRKQPLDVVHKRAASNTGKTRTEKTKRKMSESRSRVLAENPKLRFLLSNWAKTPEGKKKLREGQLGHVVSEETKRILSKQRLGKPLWTEAEKKEISRRGLGRKHSEESKQKMSEGLKLAHLRNQTDWSHGKGGRGYGGFRDNLGHYVRSRWEANFCQALKLAGIDYSYEPQWYPLRVKGKLYGSYLPDLYIPEFYCFVEIKGCGSTRKVIQFRKCYPNYRIVLVDRVIYKELVKKVFTGMFALDGSQVTVRPTRERVEAGRNALLRLLEEQAA